MGSVISARDWPVFDEYVIRHRDNVEEVIGPAEGAQILRRIDLMSPALQREALDAVIRIVRWRRRRLFERQVVQYAGLGDINRDELLSYAHRFGLLGLGPSYLIRAVQTGQSGHSLVYRVAGELRIVKSSRATFGKPSFTCAIPYPFHKEGSRFAAPHAAESYPLTHEIGSAEWWGLYAEPLGDIMRAVGGLQADPLAVEPLLADTFVRLPATRGRSIDPSTIEMRSVSAIGALALNVMAGGLEGVRVCDDERCARRFIAKRSDQRFCSDGCRDKKHKRDKYKRAKQEGGGDDA